MGARRSAWNAADIRGEVEQWIAGTGLVADAAVRIDLAEDLTARVLSACEPLLPRTDVPEHIRTWTSPEVLAVEADLVTRLIGRAEQPAHVAGFADPDLDAQPDPGPEDLDVAQRAAVATLAGSAQLLVVEGAAGAGKTKTLSATRSLLAERGHRMVVVTPTLKAAKVAGRETGTRAFSAAWLAHQHGWRWDGDGRWTREAPTPVADAVLQRGDLLLIDEAGMLDQDTARAILTLADETGARVALVGDRHQLPAVGRGGVLDLAARWARPETVVPLDVVHRFTDPEYADLSLAMRTGVRAGEVFDALVEAYQVRLYPSEAERTQALAGLAATSALSGEPGVLVMADTREQVAALNGAIRDRLIAAGYVDERRGVTTGAGEQLGVGDRVMTRRNDRDLAVANRDTWTITAIDPDGTITVQGDGSHRVPDPPNRLRARACGARLRHHRPRRPGRDHPHRPPPAGRAHHRRRGVRRDDPRPRGQPRPPGRRERRRRPSSSGSRPSAATEPISGPGTLPGEQPRISKGTPHTAHSRPHSATSVPPGPLNKTCDTPWRAARAATTSWRPTVRLPQPGPPTTAQRGRSFVPSSAPLPTRCAPSSTNPPSGPCHQDASSRNTQTGSRTATTNSN